MASFVLSEGEEESRCQDTTVQKELEKYEKKNSDYPSFINAYTLQDHGGLELIPAATERMARTPLAHLFITWLTLRGKNIQDISSPQLT